MQRPTTKEIIEKLALSYSACRDEDVNKILLFADTKGTKTSDRDKAAIRSGYHAGWHAAINFIRLHG